MTTNNDRYTMPIITVAIAENFCAINTYTAYTDVSRTINSVYYSYSGDLKKITFKNNVYDGNFYTNGKALVHLEGVLRVYFDGDSFTNNGDNTNEALNKYGSGILTKSTLEIDLLTVLSALSSFSSSTFGLSLISINRAVHVEMKNMKFDNNWMLETDYGSRA